MTVKTQDTKITPVFQLFTRSEWFLTEVLELTPDCLLVIDVKTGLIIYANKASENLYGYTQEEFIGKAIQNINISPPDEIKNRMERVIKKHPHSYRFETVHATKSGKHLPVKVISKLVILNGRKYFLSHITNITSSNKLKNKISSLITRLSNQAYRDHLTGTYNRTYLFDVYLPKIIGRNITVLLVNINYFKQLNHTKGHLIGDYILMETAKLLKSLTRNGSKVFRYSGGEFLTIVPNAGKAEAEQTAMLICSRITTQPLSFEGRAVHYSVSVGFTTGTVIDSRQFEDLVLQADKILCHAKNKGQV